MNTKKVGVWPFKPYPFALPWKKKESVVEVMFIYFTIMILIEDLQLYLFVCVSLAKVCITVVKISCCLFDLPAKN